MQKTLAASLACLLAAACGGSATSSGDLQTQSKNALPTSDSVKMKSPQSASRSPDGTNQQNATASVDTYYALTVSLGLVVNGSSAAVLGVIKAITDLPATSCDTASNTCTWGPGSGALELNNWKLVVTKQSEGHFTYALSGQSKANASGPFVTFLTGTAVAGNSPHVGSGELVIDNDARAQLPGSDGSIGKVTIDYSNTGPLSISATALGVNDASNPGQKLNIGYQYAEDSSGGGDLDVAFKNLTSSATLSMNSRWKATGAGRADVKFTNGNGTATVSANDCWDVAANAFVNLYSNTTAGTTGTASLCAYSDASYGTVSPP